MELTNKKQIRYSLNQYNLNSNSSFPGSPSLTAQETEVVTNILLMAPYLGTEGESALLKLSEALKSIGKGN